MIELEQIAEIDVDCETCPFTGTVEGSLNGDVYDWVCRECGADNFTEAVYPEPDWDLMNDARREDLR